MRLKESEIILALANLKNNGAYAGILAGSATILVNTFMDLIFRLCRKIRAQGV